MDDPGYKTIPLRAQPHPAGLRVVQLGTESFSRWDSFVNQHPWGTICHSSAWSLALEEAFPHMQGRILALIDPSSGDIKAGLPLCSARSWLTGNRLVCTPFSSWCDPLTSSEEDLDCLLTTSGTLAGTSPSKTITEIRARHTTPIVKKASLTPAGESILHFIRLDHPRADIWNAISRTGIRRRIKQAQQAGMIVEPMNSPDGIRVFNKMLVATRHRMGLPRIPERFFKALYRNLGSSNLSVLVARLKGEALGSVLTTWNAATFNLDYVGEIAPETPAGTAQLLYWRSLELAQDLGCSEFSFGRTNPTQTGLAEYKSRWGATSEMLTDFSTAPQTAVRLHRSNESNTTARRLLRMLPAPLYKMAGDFYYRHR